MFLLRRFRQRYFWNQQLADRLRQLQREHNILLAEKDVLKRWLARTLERTMPDFPLATWKPSAHFTTGHAGRMPKFLILHTTDSILSAEAQADANEAENKSNHYIIDAQGQIVQCVSEEHSSANTIDLVMGHDLFWVGADVAGNPASVAFTIELLIGEDATLSQEQLGASFALLKDLMSRHQIPFQMACETGGITGHFSLDSQRFAHCGKDFPYSTFLGYLHGEPLVPEVSKPVEETSEEQPTEAPKKARKAVKAEENPVEA